MVTKQRLRREALEFERVLTVNMSQARQRRRTLAWSASRCDTARAAGGAGGGGGGGGRLAVSWCKDGRGFGRVKCC